MSPNASSPSRRSIVLTSRALAGFGLGMILAVAVASVIAGGTDGSNLNLEAGLLAVALLGLGYWVFVRRRASREAPADVPAIRLLQRHPELLVAYNSLTHGLVEISKHSDEIFRDTAAVRLAAIQEEMQTLAAGQIIFAGTEAWRTAYEQVLRAPGLHRYFSVAWLRSEDYWRDVPGRHSMQLNYNLIELGVRIERTLILSDFFWPPAAELPANVICQWIEQQHKRGVVIRLLRESQIEGESELLCDFGIYGDRATGVLELDDQCHTVRFTLDFAPRSIQLYEDRWRRLLLFAVSFRELLARRVHRG
jgi:hypothetical protein